MAEKIKLQLEVFDDRIFDIFDPGEEIETLETGFQFIEGPAWHSKEKHLTFSDIPASKIYRWSEKTGLTVLVDGSNKSNGNTWDLEGRLVSCEHVTSVVSRRNADGTGREVLASHYDGKELNSPNDLVVKSDGSIYFTDPRFGRNGKNAARVGLFREQQLSFQGVYRLEPDRGRLILLADDFGDPNGLCFSTDEKLLYVNDSPRFHIRVFDVKPDGTLENSRVFAETKGEGPGVPDGLKVDIHDNVYCTAQGGLHIYDKTGKYLGILKMPENTANFTWGDDDFRTLYMTASTTLYRVRGKVPGANSLRPMK